MILKTEMDEKYNYNRTETKMKEALSIVIILKRVTSIRMFRR